MKEYFLVPASRYKALNDRKYEQSYSLNKDNNSLGHAPVQVSQNIEPPRQGAINTINKEYEGAQRIMKVQSYRLNYV